MPIEILARDASTKAGRTDAAFAEYRTDPRMITDMRHRFARW
jgi:hypothetical protein